MNDTRHEEVIREMARQVVLAAHSGGEGHVPSALSILDILYAIYFCSDLKIGELDNFILSKGHASLGYYAVLSAKGLIPANWVASFAKFDSPYGGHPHRLKVKEIFASTGSLGHGLPIAVGMALAEKNKDIPGRTFVLLGDGEINEGTTWEASLFAIHHCLLGLTAIIDYNRSGNRAIDLEELESKFIGIGWNVVTVNGHNLQELIESMEQKSSTKPTMIIANTVKGFRIKEMEDNPAWHHTKVNSENLTKFLKELS
jgi:transketolase